jgi:hypothetical protein
VSSGFRRRDGGPSLTGHFVRSMEERYQNDTEAHVLLDLINAEFVSDPVSVACFDLRIVDRVKVCVEKRKRITAP